MNRREAGFTILEMLIVVAMLLVIAAMGMPLASTATRNSRFKQGVNMLASELNLAKFKASAQAYEFEVQMESTNQFQLNQKAIGAPTFTQAAHTDVHQLPPGVTYGFGVVSAAAGDGTEQTVNSSSPVQSTAINFNSMGIPVDSSANPLATNAVYVTDGYNYGAVTVSLAGRILTWYWSGTAWIQG